MRRLLLSAALIGLAACADSESPDAMPAEDAAYNMIDPVKAGVEDEAAPAIGEWVRSLQDERPVLQFGPANTEPLFSIRCDDREGVLLLRHGTVATGATEMMTVAIGAASRQLAVAAVEGPLPLLRAAVPANDPLLARLRENAGPVGISVGDGPPLLLPPSPLIGPFVEGCATGDMPPISASGAEPGNAAEPANAAAPEPGAP